MRRLGRALMALAGVILCVSAHAGEPELEQASVEVRGLVHWASASRDPGGRPFAVVDKKAARLYVFEAGGRLAGSTPALLGAALGDRSVPGIGQRPVEQILPHERTTPAGRFDSEPGRNLTGEHVVWVAYDDGVAIHRLRPGDSYAPRAARLASGGGEDNRVSLGCIVVPEAFYDTVVRPVLGQRRGVVYVLPDTEPLHQVFTSWSVG